MRKIVTVLLISVIALSSVFAIDFNTDEIYAQIRNPYKNLDVRSLGMGGVGNAATNNIQALWSNPAGLADKKVQVSLPSIGVSVYNVQALSKVAEETMNSNSETSESDMFSNIFKVLGTGYGKIFDVNAGLSFTAGGFGLGIAVQDSLYTYAPKTSTGGLSSNIIDQLTAEVRAGYGHKFRFTEKFSMDIGASVGFRYMLFNEAVDANKILDITNQMQDGGDASVALSKIPLIGGWTVPINAGVRFNLPFGFKLATSISDLNFGNNMTLFDNYEGLKDAPFGGSGYEKYKLKSDFSWDAGFAWDPDWSWGFKPTLEVDFVDIWGFIEDKDFSGRSWMNHLNIGAELKGLWIFDIRGGLDRGYWTVGAGFNLYVIRVEAAYYWHEFGSVAGEKGIDGLTVQINIGW